MKCPLCNGTGEAIIGSMGLGDQLRYARESRGLTLRDVERQSGIWNPVLSQYEGGKVKQPSFQAIMKLCKVYGLDAKELSVSTKQPRRAYSQSKETSRNNT